MEGSTDIRSLIITAPPRSLPSRRDTSVIGVERGTGTHLPGRRNAAALSRGSRLAGWVDAAAVPAIADHLMPWATSKMSTSAKWRARLIETPASGAQADWLDEAASHRRSHKLFYKSDYICSYFGVQCRRSSRVIGPLPPPPTSSSVVEKPFI